LLPIKASLLAMGSFPFTKRAANLNQNTPKIGTNIIDVREVVTKSKKP
jgi:hypothetical protein